VSKSSIAAVLALAVAASLSGCSKEPAAPAASSPAAPAAGMQAAPHPIATVTADENIDLSGIERAAGGKTIAEVFAEKEQLAGQVVVFRGKLVKANAGIMGKNWLHLRDGSGAEGANNLTVTTIDVLPNVGDLLLVTGVLEVNKDFGMGYQYDVIIEDADVTVEAASSGY
jgi:type IV pilus biogenesis protein CpaD/CtpE